MNGNGRIGDDRTVRLVDYCHAHGNDGVVEDPLHVRREDDRITADLAAALVLGQLRA